MLDIDLSIALVTTLTVLGVILILALPAVPVAVVAIGVVVIRSLTDVGAASSGSLLPSSALSGLLALAALVAIIPRGRRFHSPRFWAFVIGLVGIICIAGGVALAVFGARSFILEELVRSCSIIAVFVGGALLAHDGRMSLFGVVSLVSLPAASILIAGEILQLPPLVQSGNRAVGTFSHANAAAAFLGFALLFMIWSERRSTWRKLLACGIVGVALLLTQSIGSIAALAAAMIIPALFSKRLRLSSKLAILTAVALVGFVVLNVTSVGARVFQLRSFTGSISAQSGGTSSDSLAWRFLNWRLLLDAWGERPWFGYGLGSTGSDIQPLGGPPHSLFVQVLVEGGLVGVAGVVLLLIIVGNVLAGRVRAGITDGLPLLSILVFVLILGSESNLLGYTAANYLVAIGLPSLLFKSGGGPATSPAGGMAMIRPSLRGA